MPLPTVSTIPSRAPEESIESKPKPDHKTVSEREYAKIMKDPAATSATGSSSMARSHNSLRTA
jgi:hypothetical protein